jgi:7,8-dihydropterin-6-yl-methyl-4-(beta-D-ribofuranosyl)aminobenzene 5'-phosphate synthase
MRLRVLNENTTMIDQYYLAEPGLSLLLEDGDVRLIFDTGYSGLFVTNAEAMAEDISTPTAIILSHGHDDHSAGLRHWLARFSSSQWPDALPALVAHPQAFNPKRDGDLAIGSPLSLEDLSPHFALRLSAAPLEISPRFIFLGEIPRTNPFESQEPIGEIAAVPGLTPGGNADMSTGKPPATTREPTWIPDHLHDDSALVYKGDDGLVIITGCSHSGIVNIVEYAIKVCGDPRISDIVGGFHLLDAPPARLDFTRERLAALSPHTIHPCHCTDLAARIHLAAALPVKELGVGMEFHYR